MVSYGYLIGNPRGNEIFVQTKPDELDKIHLTPSRSKFLVVGSKDSIFEWMESYGNIHCVFDQEINSRKVLTFDLYNDDRHHHDGVKGFLKKKNHSNHPEMRLEINVQCPLPSPTLTMRKLGYSGVTLRQVLNVWKNISASDQSAYLDYDR